MAAGESVNGDHITPPRPLLAQEGVGGVTEIEVVIIVNYKIDEDKRFGHTV